MLFGLIVGIHEVSKYFKRRLNKSKKLLLLTVRVDCRELEGKCHKCNNYFVNICQTVKTGLQEGVHYSKFRQSGLQAALANERCTRLNKIQTNVAVSANSCVYNGAMAMELNITSE